MRFIVASFLSVCCWQVIVAPSSSLAVDSRFELDPDYLARKVGKPATPAPDLPVQPRKEARPPAQPSAKASRKRHGHADQYTVQPGDNIYKILMREYGMSNAEAEALLPEVKRLNGLADIRSLQAGSRLTIPRRRNVRPVLSRSRQVLDREGRAGESVLPAHVMHLSASTDSGTLPVGSGLEPVRRVWDRLVPSSAAEQSSLDINGRNFSLSMDPGRFPVFPAADGGKIVVDADGSLPPLVKSLLQDSDRRVRVVSENPSDRRRFFSALLSAAKFYSVEENFAISFGSDPQLSVMADYKIEKSPDSVLRQDVVLLNTNEAQRGMPASLARFLGGEGFSVVESSLPVSGLPGKDRDKVCLVVERDPQGIADRLLTALAVPFDTDRPIAVFDQKEAGFSLSVKADRYFEDGGQRFVVSRFAKDPVNYTLTRLLETRGYRIIMLDDADTFSKVAEKLLSRLRIPGTYAKQPLWSSPEIPYTVKMSGIMLRDRQEPGRRLFLTDREMSPLVRDLVDFNGMDVQAN